MERNMGELQSRWSLRGPIGGRWAQQSRVSKPSQPSRGPALKMLELPAEKLAATSGPARRKNTQLEFSVADEGTRQNAGVPVGMLANSLHRWPQ